MAGVGGTSVKGIRRVRSVGNGPSAASRLSSPVEVAEGKHFLVVSFATSFFASPVAASLFYFRCAHAIA